MATLVLRRGELQRKPGADGISPWQRCWVKMYSDRAVDHNNSKLFDVSAVKSVVKSGDHDVVEFVVQLAAGSCMLFQAPSTHECDAWVRCITDAKRIFLASNGRMLFQQAHDVGGGAAPSSEAGGSRTSNPFIRFDDSASSNGSDDDDDDDEDEHGERTILSAANSPVKSPPRDAMARSNARTFTIVHGFINLPNGSRMIVALPYDTTTLSSLPVSACKRDMLHKLKRKIDQDFPDMTSRHGLVADIPKEDNSLFVLAIVDAIRDVWLRNETKKMRHYLDQRFDKASSVVCVEVRHVQAMPPPPLVVSILSTVNKVSDLSQKEYTAYKIQVEFNGLAWTVDRRYKQFYALHDALVREADYPYKMYLPALPPRRALTPKKGSFVAKRQQRLEAYLQDLVALPNLAEDVRVMGFLGMVSTARNSEMHPRDTRSVVHVSALHTALEYGDILLFKTRFGTSKVQRKLTGARYDHAAIVVPGSAPGLLSMLESTGEGIQVYPLKTRLLAYSREVTNAIVARRVLAPRTPETLAKLQQFVLDVNGNKYSIFGILNRTKVDDKEKTSHYFCSELVAATLQHVGWVQLNVPPSYFWPGSFAQDGEVETNHHLMPFVTLGPELSIDCKIMEVGRAQYVSGDAITK
ncbi:hypothetical protein H310_00643 [Aphanomyces invadans]|uniref:PX domain-containing protein n=1 Tax=Aphanomyces invadans TaxID=157072 RepID=A0A024UX98_9STRA|nr:hypothetical protein H310_00643 [Aphanomyces invadans]ETW10303.1 hypothetical protein H310_00643 [Aphanomyces invadans]|eukprot:XP_008861714.1 hypothetical protein H310_00643 [Aphanomyces invadans]